jgi:hypothetical protein
MVTKAATRAIAGENCKGNTVIQEVALCQRATSVVPKAQKIPHTPAIGVVFKVIAPASRCKRQILTIRRDPAPLK